MNKLYFDGQSPVKPPCLEMPLEVAQDPDLSDGAKLLCGEIYGLQLAYGKCIASDEHFMGRRNKSRSSIQGQLKELKLRGHITVVTRFKDRVIFVAERYLPTCPETRNEGSKCPETRNERAGQCPENETPSAPECPENRNDPATTCPESETPTAKLDTTCPENKTHKTPESSESESFLKDKTLRTPDSESSDSSFLDTPIDLSSFPVSEQTWMETFLETVFSNPGYAATISSARPDAIEMALLQALKAQKTSNVKSSPIGIIRSVLAEHGTAPADYVAERISNLRTALGPPQNIGPKAFQPYQQTWENPPADAKKVIPPKIARFKPKKVGDGIDMASDAEDPAQAARTTLYINDGPMLALADAVQGLGTGGVDNTRSDEDVAVNKRGVAKFREMLEVAGEKSLDAQKREAASRKRK